MKQKPSPFLNELSSFSLVRNFLNLLSMGFSRCFVISLLYHSAIQFRLPQGTDSVKLVTHRKLRSQRQVFQDFCGTFRSFRTSTVRTTVLRGLLCRPASDFSFSLCLFSLRTVLVMIQQCVIMNGKNFRGSLLTFSLKTSRSEIISFNCFLAEFISLKRCR